MSLHIAVCLKVVPRPEEVRVNPATHTLDRAGARSVINPPDMNALEVALSFKQAHGAKISLLSMGPPFFEPYLRLALMMGADAAALLSDRAFGGADTLATTYALAKGIEKLGGVDLVLCGEESSDGATAQVPPGLAEWLNFSQITYAMDLEFLPQAREIVAKRELRGGWEKIRSRLPAVVSVKAGVNEPRFMDFERREWAMKEAPVTVWSAQDIGADPKQIGFAGSPTSVAGVRDIFRGERKREFLKGSPEEIAKVLSQKLRSRLKN